MEVGRQLVTRRISAVLGGWIVAGAAAAGVPAVAGVPRLVFSQSEWDFGEVWQDDKAVFTLTVSNAGDADLKITEVRTTCGCTAAKPQRYLIPPGEATTIRIEYDTHGKQGNVSSKVIVASNDPRPAKELGNDRPRAQPGEAVFRVKGRVKRAIERTPLGGLVIRTLDGGPGQTGTLRLKNKMDQPMHLELRSNSMRELNVEIKEIAAGVTYDIVGTTVRPLPYGRYRGQLVFATGLSREPKYSVSVRVDVMRRVEPSPPAMLLRASDPAPQVRTLTLHYYGEDGPARFKVTGVKTSDPSVTVQLGPTQPPREWMSKISPPITALVETRVSLPAGTEFPRKGVTVTYLTNDPDFPRITVLATTDKPAFEKVMYGQDTSRRPPKN